MTVGNQTCIITVSDNGSTPPAAISSVAVTVTYTIIPNNVGCTGPQCGGTGANDPVTASNAVCGKITVNWQKASGAETYRIYRNSSPTLVGAAILLPDVADTGAATYSKTDNNPVAGTMYYYLVRSLAVSGTFGSAVSVPSAPIAAVACPPGQVASSSFKADSSMCR